MVYLTNNYVIKMLINEFDTSKDIKKQSCLLNLITTGLYNFGLNLVDVRYLFFKFQEYVISSNQGMKASAINFYKVIYK